MNKLSIPFILSLFFYISPINAKVPKVVSKSAKALAKVVTYNKAGDLIGNSVAFLPASRMRHTQNTKYLKMPLALRLSTRRVRRLKLKESVEQTRYTMS